MILRKPYAFLIKNFKKIHLLLGLLMIYIAYASNNVMVFFREYIANGTYTYNGAGDLVAQYVNNYMYIISLLIAVTAGIIYILMRQKDKPKLIYSIFILFYLLLLVFFGQAARYIEMLEIRTLSPQVLRVLRDISLLVTLLQYGFIFITFIRAFGFDIRRFNFGEDLQQLEIEASDSEEFELTVGIDTRKISRKLRHKKRELKYFLIENLFIISLISVIVIIVAGITLFLHFNVYNKVYQEKEAVKMGNIITTINDSYYTTKDYKGKTIAAKGKTFVIVSLTMVNSTDSSINLQLDNFDFILDDNVYPSTDDTYRSFFDLGIGFNDQKIESSSSGNYIVVFEVPIKEINDNPTLRYTETAYFTKEALNAKYKKIELNLESLDDKKSMASVNIGEKMWFGQSLLGESYLSVESFDINNKFEYDATVCVQGVCNNYTKLIIATNYNNRDNTLLKISSAYDFDEKINHMNIKQLEDLIVNFGKIKYTVDGKNYYSQIAGRTPADYKGDDSIIEVSKQLLSAQKIELIFFIRNKEYIYILKE